MLPRADAHAVQPAVMCMALSAGYALLHIKLSCRQDCPLACLMASAFCMCPYISQGMGVLFRDCSYNQLLSCIPLPLPQAHPHYTPVHGASTEHPLSPPSPFIAIAHYPRGALQTCSHYALHPTNSEARQQHQDDCSAAEKRRAAQRASKEVECSICLERPLEKENPAQRQFGLLDCDHAFCLGCIRNWRGTSLEQWTDFESVRMGHCRV